MTFCTYDPGSQITQILSRGIPRQPILRELSVPGINDLVIIVFESDGESNFPIRVYSKLGIDPGGDVLTIALGSQGDKPDMVPCTVKYSQTS